MLFRKCVQLHDGFTVAAMFVVIVKIIRGSEGRPILRIDFLFDGVRMEMDCRRKLRTSAF